MQIQRLTKPPSSLLIAVAVVVTVRMQPVEEAAGDRTPVEEDPVDKTVADVGKGTQVVDLSDMYTLCHLHKRKQPSFVPEPETISRSQVQSVRVYAGLPPM